MSSPFDVQTWAEQHLVDVLTLGSRTMDVDVEGVKKVVGDAVQLQPCFYDHHATDGTLPARGIQPRDWVVGRCPPAKCNIPC
ncbi:MAG: hypothetical protein U1F71_00335 [Verrucomicrobiaceae bacterium]